jgi:hypothetical protein
MSDPKITTWGLCDSKESGPGGYGVVVRLSGVGSLLLSLLEVHPKMSEKSDTSSYSHSMSGHDLGVMSGVKTTTWGLCQILTSQPGGYVRSRLGGYVRS